MDEERREHLEQALPDGFSRDLLDGALRVLADQANPMRAHLFAGGLRELFTYLLHNAAPDDEVRACDWFVQAHDTQTVTRRQRAVYASRADYRTNTSQVSASMSPTCTVRPSPPLMR